MRLLSTILAILLVISVSLNGYLADLRTTFSLGELAQICERGAAFYVLKYQKDIPFEDKAVRVYDIGNHCLVTAKIYMEAK